VVIAIIAILAAILFPVFAKAREKALQSTCVSNLKQIGMAVQMYAADHDGRTHYTWANEATWGVTADPQKMYWGWFYLPYAKTMQLWQCPGAKAVNNCSYGMSVYMYRCNLYTLSQPAERIFAHDAEEQFLDDNGDMLCPQDGQTVNLTQYPNEVNKLQWWRHVGTCTVLWADGHVKSVVRANSYPREWYNGG